MPMNETLCWVIQISSIPILVSVFNPYKNFVTSTHTDNPMQDCLLLFELHASIHYYTDVPERLPVFAAPSACTSSINRVTITKRIIFNHLPPLGSPLSFFRHSNLIFLASVSSSIFSKTRTRVFQVIGSFPDPRNHLDIIS